MGMVMAEHFLTDPQYALEEQPCRSEIALIAKQAGKAAERIGRLGMLKAERLLVDGQRSLAERQRALDVA
jgi:hypothetical protein